ncbi:MAG: Na/Pi cotransporter family protein [Candidatus Cloacimonadota bacterium]
MNIMGFINFFGGLALFLFGMTKMSDNLQAVAGAEMRRILKLITDRPWKGVLVGLGVTSLIQSSSATTVMLIGLVNAGIMSLQQAVGVVMGANIGTTITAQLLAFNIGKFAYAIIIVGVVLLFLKKSRAMEKWSGIVLGFGLLFIGLNVMSSAVEPLKNSQMARDLMTNVAGNPFLGILTGMLFTMIIQSSSASIGITMVLATNGLITYEGALYLVFGDNIGTTITAWLAGMGANYTAKRVAFVHTVFNVLGSVVFATLTYLGIYKVFINYITPGNVYLGENMARHVANSHTFFNVLNTIIFLPMAGLLAHLATKAIPKSKEDTLSLGEPKHLDYRLLGDSELAVDQSLKEMREMLRLVRRAVILSYEAYNEKNYRKQAKVPVIESAIDSLQKEITLYLVSLNERCNSDNVIRKIPSLLHTVNDIEKLGDYALELNNILNTQILGQRTALSENLERMVSDLQGKMMYMLDLSIEYMELLKVDYVFKIIEIEGRINEQHFNLRKEILLGIQDGTCEPSGGLNTIDFIDTVEIFADKMKNLVKAGSHGFVYNPSEDEDRFPEDFEEDDD